MLLISKKSAHKKPPKLPPQLSSNYPDLHPRIHSDETYAPVSLGAASADYWDDDVERLEEAAKYGAHAISRPNDEPEGVYEIVVDCRMDASSAVDAIRFVEPEGIITSVTYHAGETPVPLLDAYSKGVTWHIGRPNVPAQIDALCPICVRGIFHPEHLKTTFFAYEEAPAAWMSGHLRVAAIRSS